MDKKAVISFNVCAVTVIILFCYAITPVFFQNDTFYSVRIGQYILEHGIDMKDHYSWHANLPYTYPHWAYDAFLGFLYNLGGFSAVCISTIVICCVLGIVIYFVNVSLSGNRAVSMFVALFIILLLGRDYITARAQLASYILFLLEYYFIEKYLSGKSLRYAVGLVLIAVALANIHIAVWPFFFVLFLPYFGEYFVAALGEMKRLGWFSSLFRDFSRFTAEKDNAVLRLLIIAVICLFTGLLTPLHFAPYTYLYDTVMGPSLSFISEHQPLALVRSPRAIVVIGVLLIFFFMADAKIRLRDAFMTGGLLVMAFISRRHFALLSVIGMTVFNVIFCKYLSENRPPFIEKCLDFVRSTWGKAACIAAMLVITVLMTLPKLDQSFVRYGAFPEVACDYITGNLDYKNIRIFNEYGYGSYLLFRGIPVFIDSRADLYTKQFNGKKDILTDYMDVTRINVHYNKKFDEYGVTHVIAKKKSPLCILLSEDKGYRELYSDSYFALFERLPEKN
ncbi:MAG: hypothetical protein LBR64_09710 [Dysgonamonadaceae bacterium]|jgi:hypothetical protein|nr:hypothetical protein [Dysgonamonadaceae bacterium]